MSFACWVHEVFIAIHHFYIVFVPPPWMVEDILRENFYRIEAYCKLHSELVRRLALAGDNGLFLRLLSLISRALLRAVVRGHRLDQVLALLNIASGATLDLISVFYSKLSFAAWMFRRLVICYFFIVLSVWGVCQWGIIYG
jgi:hypothetical protein